MTRRPTVLYLIAKGRSGSNILAHCLGQVDGIENTGELFQFWRRAHQSGVICGCGQPITSCPLWGHVTQSPDVLDGDADTVAAWQDAVLSWRALPRLLVDPQGAAAREPMRSYLERRAALYRRIAELADASVVLDASKWPWDPVVLGLVPGVDVRVVHLVRDPRAVAHSWQRHKDWGDRPDRQDAMPRFGATYSATSWLARNLVTELVRARRPGPAWLRVRYEDFATEPAETLGRIVSFLGLDPAGLPVRDPSTITLAPTHGVAGNASKFQVGDVHLRLDDEWRTRLPPSDRRAATVVAYPLLRPYGYVSTGSTSARAESQ